MIDIASFLVLDDSTLQALQLLFIGKFVGNALKSVGRAVFGQKSSTQYVPPEQKIMPEPYWESQQREQISNTYFGNNGLLSGAIARNQNIYNQYGNLGQNFANLGYTYGNQFQTLATGQLPSAFNDNFIAGISRGVNKTIGNAVSNLASRGVLNSSVASSALSDINDSVARAAAQNYLRSLGTVGGLLSTGFDVQRDALAGQAGLLSSLYGMNNQDIANAINFYNAAANRRYGLQGDTIVNPGSPGLLGVWLSSGAPGSKKIFGW